VLEKGEATMPPAGRSDDFTWPRRQIAPYDTDPAVVTTTDPVPVMKTAPAAIVPAPEQKPLTVTTAKSGAKASAKSLRRTSRRAYQPREPRSSFSFFPFR
jgi:hypothetical protein